MTEFVNLSFEHEFVAVVTLSNPPVNALSRELFVRLDEVVDEIRGGPAQVVVLTGEGDRAFAAGGDIRDLQDFLRNPQRMEEHLLKSRHVMCRFEELDQPVIAAVQGDALGGGCELTLLCDLVLMDEDAKIGLPEVRLGLIPGGGGTQRLARRIGSVNAQMLLLTGRPISAADAVRIGLVNEATPHGETLGRALELAGQIAELPGTAVQAAKRASRYALDGPLSAGLLHEIHEFMQAFGSAEAKEGISAFLERRKPQFAAQSNFGE